MARTVRYILSVGFCCALLFTIVWDEHVLQALTPSKGMASFETLRSAEQPTNNPTQQPTNNPTEQPTNNPTQQPTNNPARQPTSNPTQQPTNNPTQQPTNNPTKSSISGDEQREELGVWARRNRVAALTHFNHNKYLNRVVHHERRYRGVFDFHFLSSTMPTQEKFLQRMRFVQNNTSLYLPEGSAIYEWAPDGGAANNVTKYYFVSCTPEEFVDTNPATCAAHVLNAMVHLGIASYSLMYYHFDLLFYPWRLCQLDTKKFWKPGGSNGPPVFYSSATTEFSAKRGAWYALHEKGLRQAIPQFLSSFPEEEIQKIYPCYSRDSGIDSFESLRDAGCFQWNWQFADFLFIPSAFASNFVQVLGFWGRYGVFHEMLLTGMLSLITSYENVDTLKYVHSDPSKKIYQVFQQGKVHHDLFHPVNLADRHMQHLMEDEFILCRGVNHDECQCLRESNGTRALL